MNKILLLKIIAVAICIAAATVTLVILGINNEIRHTYPLLYGTMYLTILQWGFIIFWTLYPNKKDIFMEYFSRFILLICWAFVIIILTNMSLFVECLADYPHDGTEPVHLRDQYPDLFIFMIVLCSFDLLSMIVFSIAISTPYMFKPIESENISPKGKNKTRFEMVRDSILVCFCIVYFIISVVILITNNDLRDKIGIAYFFAWATLVEWPLFVWAVVYSYYTKTPLFTDIKTKDRWLAYIIFSYVILQLLSHHDGACIMPSLDGKIYNLYYGYYLWTSIFAVTNFTIICTYIYICYRNRLDRPFEQVTDTQTPQPGINNGQPS